MPNFRSFGNDNCIEKMFMMRKARQFRKMWSAVITKHQAILLILTVVAIIQMHEVLIVDDYSLMDFKQISLIKP